MSQFYKRRHSKDEDSFLISLGNISSSVLFLFKQVLKNGGFILYSVTCGTLRSTLTTVWPGTAHLRSSRRSHSVWCLICNLLICSAWVCFSSWVTRTWSGKKRRLVRKNLESNNSTPTSSAHTERQRGFLHFENKIVPMCIPMSQEAGVDSAELTITSCTHYHHVGLAR